MQQASGGKLTDNQIGDVARRAGFPEQEIPTAIGVAKAESGGNPRAHNAKPPDNSYGLWQINMIGALGPERRKAFGIANNDALYDPATNAKAAYSVWKSSGWKAWSTYNNGSYKASMSPGSDNPSAPTDGDPGTAAPEAPTGGGLTDAVIGGRIGELTEKLRVTALTILIFLVALVLLIMGIVLINREKIMNMIPQKKLLDIATGLATKGGGK